MPSEADVGLSDVLLAMDVVDTLRHEQRVVSEALGEAARERALIDRVRRAYEAQGLAVSDALIEAGVAKLKEQQFDYEPPAPGFGTSMARAWVNRGRIGTGLGAVGLLAGILGGGWYGFVELPAARERAAIVTQTDTGIQDAARQLDRLEARLDELGESVAAARASAPTGPVATAVRREIDRAAALLTTGRDQLRQAAALSQTPFSTDPSNVSFSESRQARLAEQRAALAAAGVSLDGAAEAIAGIGELRALPETIAALRREGRSLAATAAARARVDSDADAALAALQRGDAVAATNTLQSLRDTLALLRSALTVRVVSRPGILSGVIRAPNDNPRANNYYLIVEAVDNEGRPARLPIRSEEDGSTRTVALFGVRVDERLFERVRRDKADDGIIQGDELGEKPRGTLDIEWSIDAPSGFIHSWASR